MRGGREHAWKRAALLLAAGAAAAGGCAWAVQGKLTTAWYEVPLPAGLEGLDGVKIAQISDVHSADLERPLGAALAAALILGAAAAYYLMFALVAWIFVLAVYFTVKLM